MPQKPKLRRLTDAQRDLAGANAGLAWSLVWRWRRMGRYLAIEEDEAISIALESLCIAASLYREDYKKDGKPIKFSTFASTWMKRLLWRQCQLHQGNYPGLIHLPAWLINGGKRRESRQKYYEKASVVRTMVAFSEWTDEIKLGHDGSRKSDYDPPDHHEGPELDLDPPARLWEAIDELTPRLREIIVQRFMHHRTLNEIGKTIGCTKERVRQLERKALEELRGSLGCGIGER